MKPQASHYLKSAALITSIVVGIVLLHNLYLYETNYGVKVGAPTHDVSKENTVDPDGGKAFLSVFIVMNAICVIGVLVKYFKDEPNYGQKRKFEFDPMEYGDNDGMTAISLVMLITYILDVIIVIGLFTNLIYLML